MWDSRLFELATTITNQTSVNCVAVTPNVVDNLNYLEKDFLHRIPVDWSDTRFIDTARREGHMEGRVEGEAQEKNATIKRLLASGASVDIIAIATGMTEANVKLLIDEISKA